MKGVFSKINSKINKGRFLISIALALILVTAVVVPVLGQGRTYMTLENGAFSGQCNLRMYGLDVSRVSTSESIRYLIAYIVGQTDDQKSLIMSGNWSANTTVFNGAIVLGWTGIYGPYSNKTAYLAHNCSACNVSPDYFWICWGSQGSYRSGFFGYSKPYLMLDGVGLGVDWGMKTVQSFGEISISGRMAIKKVSNVPTLQYYNAQVTLQSVQVNGNNISEPGWEAYSGTVKLKWDPTVANCSDNLLGNYTFICDWLSNHFDIDICPEQIE